MNGVRNWLADDERARRVMWLLLGSNIAGAVVAVATYRQHHLVSDGVLLLSTGSISVFMLVRGLGVNALWLAVVGVGLQAAVLILRWHPLGAIDLLAPLPGTVVLIVLVFRMHPPGKRDGGGSAPIAATPTGPGDEPPGPAGPLDSPPVRRPLPGDPDFTYPSPP